MADAADFISWYMLQNFPKFRTEILDAAAASVLSGYDEARVHVLSLQSIERDYTILAMASVLDVMNRYNLALEDASHLLRRLNRIASFDK